MVNQQEEIVLSLETKIKYLVSKYDNLKQLNIRLQSELTKKKDELTDIQNEVLNLQKTIDHLRIARALGVSEEERAKTKQQIGKMVREIDKCIALLNE